MADPEIHELYNVADASWAPHHNAVCQFVLSDAHIVKTIFDLTKQRFVSLYAEKIPDPDYEKILSRVHALLPDNPGITTRFFLSVQKTLLIPSVLYDPALKISLFQNHQILEADEKVENQSLRHPGADIIFAVPSHFSKLKNDAGLRIDEFFAADAAWIEGLMMNHKNAKGWHLHVNLSDGFISITVFNDDELRFYNTFLTVNAEEVLYFVMFIIEQFQMNPSSDMFFYSGFISKTDPVFEHLAKYIRHLNPEIRPSMFLYCMPILGIPQHFFIQAYSTPLCES